MDMTNDIEVCMGMGVPMGFPREWELDLNKDGMGMGTQQCGSGNG